MLPTPVWRDIYYNGNIKKFDLAKLFPVHNAGWLTVVLSAHFGETEPHDQLVEGTFLYLLVDIELFNSRSLGLLALICSWNLIKMKLA